MLFLLCILCLSLVEKALSTVMFVVWTTIPKWLRLMLTYFTRNYGIIWLQTVDESCSYPFYDFLIVTDTGVSGFSGVLSLGYKTQQSWQIACVLLFSIRVWAFTYMNMLIQLYNIHINKIHWYLISTLSTVGFAAHKGIFSSFIRKNSTAYHIFLNKHPSALHFLKVGSGAFI